MKSRNVIWSSMVVAWSVCIGLVHGESHEREYLFTWIDHVRSGNIQEIFADQVNSARFFRFVSHAHQYVMDSHYVQGCMPLLVHLGQEDTITKDQMHAIITTLLSEQASARRLSEDVACVLRDSIPEMLTRAGFDEYEEYVVTRSGRHRKKKKRRFSPQRVFSSLAHSCLQLGRLGIVGGQSAAALNLFGVLLHTASHVVTKNDNSDMTVDPAVLGGMTEQELVAHVALMLKALERIKDAKAEDKDVTALQTMQKKSLDHIQIDMDEDIAFIVDMTRAAMRTHMHHILQHGDCNQE